MLTNFFGKSNPVNFIVSGAYLLFALIVALITAQSSPFASTELLGKIGMLLLLFFSLLLLDFVIRKNSLTQMNTYAIVIFACFVAMLPVILSHRDIITSNVFVILALRRVASLPSERNIEKKLFDASFYVAIAAVFHFWSLLFFIPIYWAITKIPTRSFRMFFIPSVGILVVTILTATYHLLFRDSLQWFADWIPAIPSDFKAYNQSVLLIPSAILATLLIWILTVRLLRVSSLQRKIQRNYRLMTLMLLCSVAVAMLSDVKSGAELLFLIPSLAIVTTNYIERTKDFWFQEGLLWVIVTLPFVLFAFFGI